MASENYLKRKFITQQIERLKEDDKQGIKAKFYRVFIGNYINYNLLNLKEMWWPQ